MRIITLLFLLLTNLIISNPLYDDISYDYSNYEVEGQTLDQENFHNPNPLYDNTYQKVIIFKSVYEEEITSKIIDFRESILDLRASLIKSYQDDESKIVDEILTSEKESMIVSFIDDFPEELQEKANKYFDSFKELFSKSSSDTLTSNDLHTNLFKMNLMLLEVGLLPIADKEEIIDDEDSKSLSLFYNEYYLWIKRTLVINKYILPEEVGIIIDYNLEDYKRDTKVLLNKLKLVSNNQINKSNLNKAISMVFISSQSGDFSLLSFNKKIIHIFNQTKKGVVTPTPGYSMRWEFSNIKINGKKKNLKIYSNQPNSIEWDQKLTSYTSKGVYTDTPSLLAIIKRGPVYWEHTGIVINVPKKKLFKNQTAKLKTSFTFNLNNQNKLGKYEFLLGYINGLALDVGSKKLGQIEIVQGEEVNSSLVLKELVLNTKNEKGFLRITPMEDLKGSIKIKSDLEDPTVLNNQAYKMEILHIAKSNNIKTTLKSWLINPSDIMPGKTTSIPFIIHYKDLTWLEEGEGIIQAILSLNEKQVKTVITYTDGYYIKGWYKCLQAQKLSSAKEVATITQEDVNNDSSGTNPGKYYHIDKNFPLFPTVHKNPCRFTIVNKNGKTLKKAGAEMHIHVKESVCHLGQKDVVADSEFNRGCYQHSKRVKRRMYWYEKDDDSLTVRSKNHPSKSAYTYRPDVGFFEVDFESYAYYHKKYNNENKKSGVEDTEPPELGQPERGKVYFEYRSIDFWGGKKTSKKKKVKQFLLYKGDNENSLDNEVKGSLKENMMWMQNQWIFTEPSIENPTWFVTMFVYYLEKNIKRHKNVFETFKYFNFQIGVKIDDYLKDKNAINLTIMGRWLHDLGETNIDGKTIYIDLYDSNFRKPSFFETPLKELMSSTAFTGKSHSYSLFLHEVRHAWQILLQTLAEKESLNSDKDELLQKFFFKKQGIGLFGKFCIFGEIQKVDGVDQCTYSSKEGLINPSKIKKWSDIGVGFLIDPKFSLKYQNYSKSNFNLLPNSKFKENLYDDYNDESIFDIQSAVEMDAYFFSSYFGKTTSPPQENTNPPNSGSENGQDPSPPDSDEDSENNEDLIIDSPPKAKYKVEKENFISKKTRNLLGQTYIDYTYKRENTNKSVEVFIQDSEVTQSQWQKIMGYNNSKDKGDHNPVTNISYIEIREYLKKVNKLSDVYKYRLPTSREWYNGARGGTVSHIPYHFGYNAEYLKDYGWYSANSGSKTHIIRQLKPNKNGLYDIHGNVREMTTNPADSKSVIIRDCSYGSWFPNCATRKNSTLGIDEKSNDIGFRLILDPSAIIIDDSLDIFPKEKNQYKSFFIRIESETTGEIYITYSWSYTKKASVPQKYTKPVHIAVSQNLTLDFKAFVIKNGIKSEITSMQYILHPTK